MYYHVRVCSGYMHSSPLSNLLPLVYVGINTDAPHSASCPGSCFLLLAL